MEFEVKIIFKGQVQGVFFRSHVKKHADNLGLKGYAKNLNDGSVEVVAIGEKKFLEEFIEKIKREPGFGRIDEEKKNYQKITKRYSDFRTY
jgi:acylphosphatase